MARKGDGIFKRGKVWRMDAIIKGKRYQIALGRGITRAVALELASVQRAKILRGESGIDQKKADVSFESAAEMFLTWAQANKRPRTLQSYRSNMKNLSRTFKAKMLSEITPYMLEEYKQGRVAAGNKVAANRDLSRLRTLYNLCIRWKKFEGENPARRYQPTRESSGRIRFLSEDEESRLLAFCEEPLLSLVEIGIHTGLRVQSEGLTLTWPNVDFKQQSVTVEDHFAKNGESRTVPLNSVALATMMRLKGRGYGPHVFMVNKGAKRRGDKHWEPYRSFRTAFETACRRANLPDVTPHVLRHTFASRLVMRGADLRTVQELGGWKSLAMVMRYAHLSPEHKRNAVELLAANSPSVITTAAPEAVIWNAGNLNTVN